MDRRTDPYHGSDQGAMPPGFGSGSAEEAYERYTDFLELVFHPGAPGQQPRPISAPLAPEPAIEEAAETAD